MSVIYAPIYKHPDGFASLDELLETIGDSINYRLEDVVRFNLHYRSYARRFGIAAIEEKLLHESPRLKDYPKALSILRERLEYEPISDKDLFYWPKDGCLECAAFTISLGALKNAVEVSGYCTSGKNEYTWKKNFKPIALGYHVAKLWESVPHFDSSDYAYDNGSFENYFISRSPFTDEILHNLQEIKDGINACKLTEHTPSSALPAVYFDGESDFMIVGLPLPIE